jgi:alkanesulfonate monooxygenase SsuD/methylene tetrahydromethanopterin reductase-like flavin-dependent oxidoreductase (luciferase family)
LKAVAGLLPTDLLIAGTSGQCVDGVESFAEMGVEHLILQFRSVGDIRFFAEEVMSRFT